jgi:adenylate cyclase
MAMLDRHDRLLVPQIEKHGGRVVKKIGDALMATFDHPLAAVLAAVDMQVALRDFNRAAPPDERILVRIGINAGRVILKEGDVYGDAVNVASRVEGIAGPEQILITRDVRDFVDEARLALKDLGPQTLKGKPEPVPVFEVRYG